MGAGAQPPVFDSIHRFKNPALLVVGGEDEKFQGIATLLKSDMPNAQIAVLEGQMRILNAAVPRLQARIQELRRQVAN